MFCKIAHRYDLLNHLLSLNVDRIWRSRLVGAACVPEGGRVLDACAGTGDVAMAFARCAVAREVVAVDLSREMLRIGRAKARRANIEGGVRFVEGDVLFLPFRERSFDVVTIAFGLRNLASYEKGLSEMSRVLVRGGRIAILEFAPSPRGFFASVYAFYLRKAIPRIGGLVSGSKAAYDYLASSVGEFPSVERVLALMAGAGLRNLSAESLTGGIVYIYRGEK